ncbi:MAG: hypothetical protein IJF54_00110 [Clostridia bacterium]|nr:hypothetical protein [Clostridia bacterium]
MKKLLIKIPAIIAMIISAISFGFMIVSLIATFTESSVDNGISDSFRFWAYGVIFAIFSVIFYFIDAVFLIIKAFKKINPIINAILSVMLIGAIPMVIIFGGGLGINIYIWNAYYLAIFILEIVSTVKHIKMN